jgi:hypothetical protein
MQLRALPLPQVWQGQPPGAPELQDHVAPYPAAPHAHPPFQDHLPYSPQQQQAKAKAQDWYPQQPLPLYSPDPSHVQLYSHHHHHHHHLPLQQAPPGSQPMLAHYGRGPHPTGREADSGWPASAATGR